MSEKAFELEPEVIEDYIKVARNDIKPKATKPVDLYKLDQDTFDELKNTHNIFMSNRQIFNMQMRLPLGIFKKKLPTPFGDKCLDDIPRLRPLSIVSRDRLSRWDSRKTLLTDSEFELHPEHPMVFVFEYDPNKRMSMYFMQNLGHKCTSKTLELGTGYITHILPETVIVKKIVSTFKQKTVDKMYTEFVKTCNRLLFINCEF